MSTLYSKRRGNSPNRGKIKEGPLLGEYCGLTVLRKAGRLGLFEKVASEEGLEEAREQVMHTSGGRGFQREQLMTWLWTGPCLACRSEWVRERRGGEAVPWGPLWGTWLLPSVKWEDPG